MLTVVDVGYGHVKAITDAKKDGVVFPSICTATPTLPKEVDYGFASSKTIPSHELLTISDGENDYGHWFVGNEAVKKPNSQHSRQDDRYLEREYDVLVLSSLVALGVPNGEVELVLDLNARIYNKETRKTLEKRYKGREFEVLDANRKSHKYKIAGCLVLAQGVSALWASLSPEQIQEGVYAILDIGSRTTDYTLYDNATIDADYTDAFNSAVFNVIDDVRQYIKKEYSDDIEEKVIDAVLFAHLNKKEPFQFEKIGSDRKTVNLESVLKKSIDSIGSVIVQKFLTELEPRLRDIDQIVLVGGGASLFEPVIREKLKKYGVTTVKNPQMANADGAFRVGKEYFAVPAK